MTAAPHAETIAEIQRQVSDVLKDIKSRHSSDQLRVAILPPMAMAAVGSIAGAAFADKTPGWMSAAPVGAAVFVACFFVLILYVAHAALLYRNGWLTANDAGGIVIKLLLDNVVERIDRASASIKSAESALERKLEPFLLHHWKSRHLEEASETVRSVTRDLAWPANNISRIVDELKAHPTHSYQYLIFHGGKDSTFNAVRKNVEIIRAFFEKEGGDFRPRLAIKMLCLKGDRIVSYAVDLARDADSVRQQLLAIQVSGLRLPLFSDLVIYENIDPQLVPSTENSGLGNFDDLASKKAIVVISSSPFVGVSGDYEPMGPMLDYAFSNPQQVKVCRDWFETCWEAHA